MEFVRVKNEELILGSRSLIAGGGQGEAHKRIANLDHRPCKNNLLKYLLILVSLTFMECLL